MNSWTRLEQTFLELCAIPSPSGNEAAVGQYIRATLKALDIPVQEDAAGPALGSTTGNLMVRLPASPQGATAPALFLAAHMDTVPPDPVDGAVPVLVDGDKVHTAGKSVLGGDDKLGVAVALEMIYLAVADARPLPAPLEVVFTVQEERGARGAAFASQHLTATQGFVLDGEGPVYSAIIKAPAKCRYHVNVTGRRSHAAVEPEVGRNAVAAAGEIAAHAPQGRLSADSTANVSGISGGGPSNIVPEHASVSGEMRSFNPESLEATQAVLERLCAQVATARDVSVEVAWEHLYNRYEIPETARCRQLFEQGCRTQGHEPRFMESLGGGDANALNSDERQCLVFGLGMHNIHSRDEYALRSELQDACDLLATIIWDSAEQGSNVTLLDPTS
jgi:tripeptide aminopeptidase